MRKGVKTQLVNELAKREREIEEDKTRSDAVQKWAKDQREKINQSLKLEKIDKMERLQRALKNPKVRDLLLKVMNHKITQEQAFADIKSNPDLKKQMMSLTLTGTGTRKGGKSRVFRRKNKKTRSKSRRNAQYTRRHRKSSSRRSTRK